MEPGAASSGSNSDHAVIIESSDESLPDLVGNESEDESTSDDGDESEDESTSDDGLPDLVSSTDDDEGDLSGLGRAVWLATSRLRSIPTTTFTRSNICTNDAE